MRVSKISVSEVQKLQFVTVREMCPENYVVLTVPLGFSVEVTEGNTLHIRAKRQNGGLRMTDERPFCCICKTDFPVAEEPTAWRMGQLRKLKKAPKWIRVRFKDWLNSEIHGEGYLCGNCLFDLEEEKEEEKLMRGGG